MISVACALGCVELSGAWAAHEPDPVPQSVSDGSGYLEAKELMGKRKWAEAAIVLRRAARLDGTAGSRDMSMDFAKALFYSGRREEALSVLAQASGRSSAREREELIRRARVISKTFVTQVGLQIHQEGIGLLFGGKFRAARDSFERALALEPDNVEILIRSAQALALEGDFDSAAERLRFARKLNPHEPQVHLWLGRTLHQRGELTEAIAELKVAKAELGRSETGSVWLAEALASLGNRQAALMVLDEASRVEPFYLWAMLSAAKMRLTSGNRDAATKGLVRRDLQLILSRIDEYPALEKFDELAFDLRSRDEIRQSAQVMLQQLDGQQK